MGALAIILAREGSKGLTGKNLREIAGRPCCAWTIDDARAASCVERVAISTDSAELQRLGISMGIDVVARPAELARDDSTIDDAARHAAGALGAHDNQPIVILYANVPLRPEWLIDRAVALLQDTACDSVQSYEEAGKRHPWWTAVVEKDATVRAFDCGALNHGVYRRQDLPPAHVPDGGVIVLSRRALRLEIEGVEPGPHAFLGQDRRGIVSPRGSVLDIDEEIDAQVAEQALRRRVGGVGVA